MPTGHYKRTPKTIYPKKLRNCYHSMMGRCYCPKNIGYDQYGGRGVTVCEEWKGHINVFCEWAIQNGWTELLQLDKDIKGNGLIYSPLTCTFVTPRQNSRNRSNNKRIPYNGEMLTIPEICEKYGVSRRSLVYKTYNK